MRWMFIAVGLLAMASAVSVMAAWNRITDKKQKCEISMAATVKRVWESKETGPMVSFVSQNGELSFPISSEIARQLNPGERGVLTYQEKKFVYFVSKEKLMNVSAVESLASVS